MTRTGSCHKCGECCRLIGFHFDIKVPGALEWLAARGWKMHNGLAVKHDPCPHLKGNKCELHDLCKPEVCRTFPWGPADLLDGCGYGFEEVTND